jgi:hypothetical protein
MAQVTTEFSGGTAIIVDQVDAGTRTNTITCTGLTTIKGVSVVLAEAPTAAAALVMATYSGNVVYVREYTAQGTLNTQTALDFNLVVIGQY